MHRRRCTALPALLGVVLAGGCSQFHQQSKQDAEARWETMRARAKLRLASNVFDAGDANQALDALREALQLDGDAPGAAVLLAKIQFARGRLGAARKALRWVRPDDVGAVEANYLWGAMEERAGRPKEAFEAYRAAYDAETDNVAYFAALGESMLALGFAEQVPRWLDEKEEAHGHTATFHALRGRAFRLAGRYAEAAAAYATALELGVGDDRIREARALCLLWAGEYDPAATALAELLADEPLSARPALQLAYARALLEVGRVELARERLGLLGRDTADSAPRRELMARAAWQSHDPRAALVHAKRAVALDGERTQAHLMTAVFAYRLGQHEEAQQSLRAVLDAEPDNRLAHRLADQLAQSDRAPNPTPAPRDAARRPVLGRAVQTVAGHARYAVRTIGNIVLEALVVVREARSTKRVASAPG